MDNRKRLVEAGSRDSPYAGFLVVVPHRPQACARGEAAVSWLTQLR